MTSRAKGRQTTAERLGEAIEEAVAPVDRGEPEMVEDRP
jgi:hypothetical protein